MFYLKKIIPIEEVSELINIVNLYYVKKVEIMKSQTKDIEIKIFLSMDLFETSDYTKHQIIIKQFRKELSEILTNPILTEKEKRVVYKCGKILSKDNYTSIENYFSVKRISDKYKLNFTTYPVFYPYVHLLRKYKDYNHGK